MTMALAKYESEIIASRIKELPGKPMTAKEMGLGRVIITSLTLRGIIQGAGRRKVSYIRSDRRNGTYQARVWKCGPCWRSFAERHGWISQSEVRPCASNANP